MSEYVMDSSIHGNEEADLFIYSDWSVCKRWLYLGVVQDSGLRVARKEMYAVMTEKINHVVRNLHQCSLVVK